MAESVDPAASAAIVSITPDEQAASAAAKRRQSPVSEDDKSPKRAKISTDDVAQAAPLDASKNTSPSKDSRQERRKTSIIEEKKRGQRLFGGLLSTLSQDTPIRQNNRRQDIEKRHAESAKAQKAQDKTKRKEKLAELSIIRKAEQVKWNHESMKTRHDDMLARANFLETKAKPKLYYKPWELLPEQSRTIGEQVAAVKVLIENEVTEFKLKYPKTAEVGPEIVKDDYTSKENLGEPYTKYPQPAAANLNDTTNLEQKAMFEEQKDEVDGVRKPEENTNEVHNGEVMMENDEDTVIY